MNHKLYENWILDEPELSAAQKKELAKHLSTCPQCKRMDTGWQASKQLMSRAAAKAPTTGFDLRWNAYAEKKRNHEKIRRYRLSLTGLLFLSFTASLIYMVASGSFMQMLADAFNGITNLIIGLTSGLSSLGLWVYSLPVAIPLTIGFIFFGLMNAFIIVALFTIWNLKHKRAQVDEIEVE